MAKKRDDALVNVTVSSPKKHPVLRMVLFVLELLILLICIVGSILFISGKNNPRHTVEQFYEALAKGDFPLAYGMMVPERETEFINEEMFALAMTDRGFDSGRYHLRRQSENVYILEDNSNDDYPPMVLTLQEKEEKHFFIFKEYEIAIEGIYAQDVSFIVPKYITLTVNGVELDSDNSRINARVNGERLTNSYEVSYTIANMYSGEYLVEVSGEIYQPYAEWIVVENTDTVSNYDAAVNFRMEPPLLTPEVVDILGQRAYEDFQAVFQAALNQDDHSPFDEAEFSDNFNGAYYFSNLKEDLLPEYHGFYDSINMRDFDAQIVAHYYDYGSGSLVVNVELNYSQEIAYQTYDQWYGTYTSHNKTGTAMAHFYYYYRSGEWALRSYDLDHRMNINW